MTFLAWQWLMYYELYIYCLPSCSAYNMYLFNLQTANHILILIIMIKIYLLFKMWFSNFEFFLDSGKEYDAQIVNYDPLSMAMTHVLCNCTYTDCLVVCSGCSPCDCDVGGSHHNLCDKVTGQCLCRSYITGRQCNQ